MACKHINAAGETLFSMFWHGSQADKDFQSSNRQKPHSRFTRKIALSALILLYVKTLTLKLGASIIGIILINFFRIVPTG